MGSQKKQQQLLDEYLATQAAGVVEEDEANQFDRCRKLAGKYDRPPLDNKLQMIIRLHKAGEKLRAVLCRMGKPAAIMLVSLLAVYGFIMLVEALRVPFLNLFVREQETHTDYGITLSNKDLRAAGILYIPAYLPDGYIPVHVDGDKVKTVIYTNGAGDSIIVEQSDSGLNVSSDGETERREITVQGGPAYLITGKDQTILFWEQDGIFLKIIAALEPEEVVRVAESLTEIK